MGVNNRRVWKPDNEIRDLAVCHAGSFIDNPSTFIGYTRVALRVYRVLFIAKNLCF